MKKRIHTRILAWVLTFAMVSSMFPVTAFAEEASKSAECIHSHDEFCGYVAAVEEVPCDKECTDTDGDGLIDHAEECAYTPAVQGQPCTHVHDESCGGVIVKQSEKDIEAEAPTEDTSDREESLLELITLLNELPDPMAYLADGTAKESILDGDQLAQARAAVDDWFAGEEEAYSSSAQEQEELQSLILRLEGLEHIRDTETDCLDMDCPYHYPEIIQEQMAEDETPKPLTLDDLVEDYGVEPPMQTFSRLRSASVPHPQTLMLTEDNENNSHTGSSDGDIDKILSNLDGNHPIEMSFTLTEVPTQSAYLAVKAYDVDEDWGETDYVYINDDIFEEYNDSTIGYLSGTDNTWNTTILKIPLEKLKVGKNTISVTIASGWVVNVDWMQLILDGGAEDSNIQEFSLKLEDSAASGDNVTVQSSVTVRRTGNANYTTEYTLTQNETGNALDACFGTVLDSETIELSMPLDSRSGIYTITGILKDSETEQIKATDSVSFYFLQNVGLGPKISHTLTPDQLTNQDVTIQLRAEAVPEVGITGVSVSEDSKTVQENGSYSFTVNYTMNGNSHSVDYTVNVDNIDKVNPTLTYFHIAVPQGEAYETVKKLFADNLSVSDNGTLAGEPLSYTIPENISQTGGEKTITVTATDAAGNTTTQDCTITVLAKPVKLTMGELTPVSGSKDSYTLNAVLEYGSDQITETGFVWGVMPNPTLELNNGSVKTASVVQATGGTLTGTTMGLLSGVEYYARAYAKVTETGGSTNVVYSEAGTFGFGTPSYGTFSVSGVSGSTFTITRSGGTDGAQTVYYRTVNGSAIGGTHFTHQAGTLTFVDGETSKTVTVAELGVTSAYNNDAGTKYSNADRTYSLEIYRVEGGGAIDQNQRSKKRTMTKNSSYSVDRSVYTTEKSKTQVAAVTGTSGKKVADTTENQGGTNYDKVSFLTNRDGNTNYNTSSSFSTYYTDTDQAAYLNATATGWYYRYVLQAYEYEDGYEHAYIGTSPLEDKHYGISKGEGYPVSGLGGQLWACTFLQGEGSAVGTYNFPSTKQGGGENSHYPKNSSGSCVSYNNQTYVSLGLTNNAYCYFGANGRNTDIWYVDGLTSYALVKDDREPALLGVAPMAAGTYLPGDPITVALVFDEIVDSTNSSLGSVSINTNVGTLTYTGGADTNVLYFTGTVDSTANLNGSGDLKVTGINNSSYIKDMCSTAGTTSTSTSGSSNVIVDATKPTVTITANTSGSLPQHKATITATNANALQYAWTQSTDLPAYGWSNVASGTTLTESRGTAGATETWYLHVLATSSSGATTHKYQSFTFQQPNITEVSVRAGESSDSADVEDVWKPSKYIVVTYAGAQTSGTTLAFAGPVTSSQNITSASGTASLQVTKNGTYTVTLKDNYGNVISKTVEVKKIDADKPTVTLRSGNSTETGTVYNSLNIAVLPEDKGGSGLAKVEYAWTNSAAAPTSWSQLAASDGSYQAVYTATETTKTAKYLHVKVTDGAGNVSSVATSGPYQVIKKATGTALPSITVTGNPTAWKNSATLTWDAQKGSGTGAGAIQSVYTPDGVITDQTSGTCTVTKNGLYTFVVTDVNGNSATKEVNVTWVDREAPKLTSLTAQAGHSSGTIKLAGVTDNCTVIYDSNGNYSSISGSGIKSRQYKLEGTSTWNNFTVDNISVSKNGTYIVKLTDQLDNSKEYSVKMEGIDATVPKVTCTIGATANANSGWYTTMNLPVVLTFTDEAGSEGGTPSGIESVQYQWVTSNTTGPTSELISASAAIIVNGTVTPTLGSQGTWYLYYKVTDKKGNVTEGFSNEIKKDTYSPSYVITGPSTGQPISSGLAMQCQVTYGPSGGRITGGPAAASARLLATFAQSTGTVSRNTTVDYTAKTTGTNEFRFYQYAANGASGTGSCNSWPFYVRQITFNSQGGSTVESQLVWNKSETSTELVCAVTKPSNPTRTGYTFGGWYTDAACTDGKQFNFDTQTQVKTDTTLYAKWTANTYTVTYHLTNPNGDIYTPGEDLKNYTYGQGLTLPVLAQEGFAFSGWYDNANYTGTEYTVIGSTETGNKEYYAYYQDVTKPSISVSADGYLAGEDGWWRNNSSEQVKLSVTYSDNVNVTELWVKIDNGAFTQIASFAASGPFSYTSLQEGVHTYTFKVVDAAGNENTASTTMKLDTGKPEIGTITCDQKAANIFDWIIGKKSLIIHIPVTDNTSGVKTITYTQTPSGGTAETKTITLSGTTGTQTANLTLNADWKGTITNITCTDISGNVSDSKAIEGAGNGMIVEDNAPVITITEADMSDATNPKPGNTVSENYYDENNVPTLYVAVKDDIAGETTVITAGIQSISYRINGGTAVNVTGSFATALTGNWDFTIPLDGKTGLVNVEVTAVDYAGNTANSSVVVKIKGKEATPGAQLNYRKDALTNLVPGADYKITITGEGSGSSVTITCKADENGEIPFIINDENNNSIDLCGKTIAIVRKGEGTNSSDSNAQNLSMAARPAAPSVTKTDETIKGKQDGTLTGVDTTMEYRVAGSSNWTSINESNIKEGRITGLGPCTIHIREKAMTSVPHGEVQTVTIAEGRTLTVTFVSNGGGDVAAITGKSWNDIVDNPGNPTKEGYAFEGWYQDSTYETIWNFASDKLTDDVTLYAKWRDNVKPNLSAALSDGNNGQNWYNSLSFTLTYSDNVGVTKLYVKTDDAYYTELNINNSAENGTDGNGNSRYQLIFNGLNEGSHTYTFKAVDAAGNETFTTAYTAKLDTTKPALGESSFNEGYRNLWDWIIRKDSLIITIPVTETGSGIETVTYTLMPENGQTEDEKTATLHAVTDGTADYEAKIYIAPDFKGRVAIEAKDKAGNVSLSKTIGTDGNGIKGILVEDNAPEITILADRGITDVDSTSQSGTELSTGYYNSAPKLLVTVEDDANNAVTGGLKSVTWKLDNGAVQNVSEDFQSSMKTQYSFTINELQGKTGSFTVTVNTEDQAGNTASKSVTVHIKGKEEKPNPSVDYLQEKLTGLVSGAVYVIEGENITKETITADAQGDIVIKEAWFGNTIQISRCGGTTTLDSEKANVSIASRPAAPSVTKMDETIKGKKDGIVTGVDTTMEYSVDGVNWTSITGSSITGLGPCTIQIREKATTSVPHGKVQTVTIAEGRTLTVTFVSNGGSNVSSITGKSWEATVAKPENPLKAGYTFEGWYRENTFETIWNFASETGADKLTDDVTLYAKWTLNKPSVTLAADGGTTNPVTGVIEAIYNNGNTLITLMAETSHAVAPEGSSFNITYTYQWYRDGQVLTDMDSTVRSLALKNVNQSGTYTVKVTAKDEEGRTSEAGSSNEVIVNIAKAPITFTVSENTHFYDATAKTASVEQTAGQTPRIDSDGYEVSYEQNGNKVAAPTDAGTYDVIVNLKDNNFSHFGQSDSVTKQKVGELIIEKKRVTAVWTNLTAEYNGTAQAPVCTTLVGLMETDVGDVSANFTEQRLTNAGTKRLTAVLAGTRADNYQLTNAEVNFTVQKAPVTFNVTDNFVLADNHSHTATVSASVNGVSLDAVDCNGNPVYEITYRDVRGKTVEEPTDAGTYAIYAKLMNPNYRHSGTAEAAARQIGVLTIYRNQTQTPKTYTVKYVSGAEGASEVTGDLPAEQKGLSEGTLIYLPEKGTLSRTGYAFTGWLLNGKLYQPGETFTMPAKNVTITACWKEATYCISGVVDQEGNPLHHAVVTLKRGSEIIGETTTDTAGKYSFEGVIPGLYNLITSYDGIITTVKVLIVDADAEQNATLPAGRTNSILDVMAGAPAVVVGNLEKLFQIAEESGAPVYPEIYTDSDKNLVESGGTVEIRLTVEKVAEPDQTGADLLKEAMKKLPEVFEYQTELYLDLVLQKTVYSAAVSGSGSAVTKTLSDSHVILESVISLPSNLQNRRFYKVYRIHQNAPGDIVLEELTEQPNTEGEYFELNPENTEMTIHARKYSVYSVAASDYVAPQPANPESSEETGEHFVTGLPEETIQLPEEEKKAKNSQINENPLDKETKLPEESDAETEKTEVILEDILTEEVPVEETITNETIGKPFVLLNVLLTLLSLAIAALMMMSRQEKKRKIAVAIVAAISLLILLLTLGFHGVRLADLRTILFAVLVAAQVILGLTGINREDKKEEV